MLKYKYDDVNDIPEDYRSLYSVSNGVFILTGVSGVKTQDDIDRLQESLRKEREDHKHTKEHLRSYNVIGDPNEIQQKLDRIQELEAASADKLDENKLNEIVEGRIKSRTAPLERDLMKLTEERDSLKNSVIEFETQNKRRMIHDELRKASMTAKVRDTALDDVMLYDSVFTIDESTGRVITKDNVGVTPGIDASVWLTEIKNSKPHWWPESHGVGARGGDAGGGANNPFSADNWNMTEQGRIVRDDPAKADQLARAAGTTVGGAKPVKK